MASVSSGLAQFASASSVKRTTGMTDHGWPRTFSSSATSISIYQPQIEQWKDNRFEGRAAVAVAGAQGKQPTYGVVWFAARTEIDKVNRLVTMADFVVTKVSFPTSPERTTALQSVLQAQALKAGEVIALDRLLAEMAITQARISNAGYELRNDPPQIFFSTRRSILVLIDGEPVLRPVKGSDLSRVINTRTLILHDGSKGKYYLRLMGGWMESDAAAGPWSIAWDAPSDLKKALAAAAETGQVDLLEGTGEGKLLLSEAAKQGALPAIYVSFKPAELLQTLGEPQLTSIEATQLLYVTNTENDIFIDTATAARFVLVSGRWFRGESMKGPWEYVAGDRLPADFAKIPLTHEKASILASVPGTPQATEALIANEIPQTATISRRAAKLTVSYDGQPQLKSIEGTTLKYAVNTSTPVIFVSGGYYAVMNGVWFVGNSASGPWVVATSVPAVIYTIPPSSPVHNVTYVKVYGSTADVVYVGYTPGYYGTVVSSNKVVVYGGGWYFPPYIGGVWHGWGYTYGYGAGFTWTAATGWGVAYGIGYGWSSYYYPGAWYAASYGGYYPSVWGGAAAANVYGRWGNVAYAGTRAAWANPYTGNVGYGGVYSGVNAATGTRVNGRGFTNTNVYTGTTVSGVGGAVYNPITGRSAAGQAGAISNAYAGNAAAGARGVGYNPQTGVVSGGAVGGVYNAATGQTTAAGRGFAYNTKTDTGVAVGKNNVYAGKDGEIYRYNKTSGLEQRSGDGWQSVTRQAEIQNLQSQRSARTAGEQRWEGFRASGGRGANSGVVGPRPGSGGGGPRGGGRFRR
jgi:hypothetical protein